MNIEEYMLTAGPSFGLDWSNPRHAIALRTVTEEHEGTELHRRVNQCDPIALNALMILAGDKIRDAMVLRRMFYADGARPKGWT